MVSKTNDNKYDRRDVVNNIRRGSARQHLDYVLIYEVSDTSDKTRNALQIADLSIWLKLSCLNCAILQPRKWPRIRVHLSSIKLRGRKSPQLAAFGFFAPHYQNIAIKSAQSQQIA